jgi:DNA-binding transcriptional MerR regulator
MEKKEVYTSGDIAKILKVTTNTVTKWFDLGIIKGYTLPESKARRITSANFQVFVKKFKIPVDRLQRERAFTTAECAHFCYVTTNTVTKWADKGLLLFFNLGGSGRRLIFLKDIQAFMKENSIPVERINKYLASPKKKAKSKNNRKKTARKRKTKKRTKAGKRTKKKTKRRTVRGRKG